jgi:hypothetical protein
MCSVPDMGTRIAREAKEYASTDGAMKARGGKEYAPTWNMGMRLILLMGFIRSFSGIRELNQHSSLCLLFVPPHSDAGSALCG